MWALVAVVPKPTPEQLSRQRRERQAEEREKRFAEQQQQQVRRGRVNMDNYNRLVAGMTYEQVVEILGKEGTEMSRVESVEYPTVMYMWEAGGLSIGNMNVTFQNGGLISKAQFGLP
jgi:hypothetical protein